MSNSETETISKEDKFSASCLMLKMQTQLSKSSTKLAWGGILLVPLFLISDAWLDCYIFGGHASYANALFQPEPTELWMRLMVSFMFVAFGIYGAMLLNRAERVEQKLRISNEQLETLKTELERLVVIDALTGVFNRRKFHESIDVSISTAVRHQELFALLIIDIDYFKSVNDRFGHQVGDTVLRNVCELITSSIRNSDQMFRIGGEEFCLIARVNDEEHAKTLAEKIRHVIDSHIFAEAGKVTISIGITCFKDNDSQQDIFSRADSALFSAKDQGRNRVVMSN